MITGRNVSVFLTVKSLNFGNNTRNIDFCGSCSIQHIRFLSLLCVCGYNSPSCKYLVTEKTELVPLSQMATE
jgi:hypothetical protein